MEMLLQWFEVRTWYTVKSKLVNAYHTFVIDICFKCLNFWVFIYMFFFGLNMSNFVLLRRYFTSWKPQLISILMKSFVLSYFRIKLNWYFALSLLMLPDRATHCMCTGLCKALLGIDDATYGTSTTEYILFSHNYYLNTQMLLSFTDVCPHISSGVHLIGQKAVIYNKNVTSQVFHIFSSYQNIRQKDQRRDTTNRKTWVCLYEQCHI